MSIINKKFLLVIVFAGVFFISLNIANAGSLKQGSACTLNSSDCAAGLYCYNGTLRNYCTPQLVDQARCAEGSNVTQSDLANCTYGCPNGTYYDWLANTNAAGNNDYRCGTAANGATHGGTPATGATITGTPANATVTAGAATGGSVSFTNPLGYSTVEDLLSNVLSAIQKIIVTLALIFIAIGAVMILVSAGSPETVEKGKKAITMAIVGLALGIAAPSILKELAGILGWGTTNASVTAAASLSAIALKVLNFLLGIAGVLSLIMLVVGAIMYLTSAGDEDRIDTGKKIFKNSLIGVIIIMSSLVIVAQIARFFAVS